VTWRSPHLEGYWHPAAIPDNVVLAEGSYLESAYVLSGFHSRRRPGLVLEAGAGAYGPAAFLVGPAGRVTVGAFACVNSATIVANAHVSIGAHALVAWGAVITDSWPGPGTSAAARRAAVIASARDPARVLPGGGDGDPVVGGEGAWVGFNAVVLPGVTLGRGCVVGAGSVVDGDVPALTVVAGNPARPVRQLDGRSGSPPTSPHS